jgi:hypothetical protein
MSDQHDNIFSINKSKDMDNEVNENLAKIGHSGNSDVDVHVNVQVDTRPIAYAMLCSLLATKQITSVEFESAIGRLDELTADYGNQSDVKVNDSAKTKQHNQNNVPGLRLFGPMRKER